MNQEILVSALYVLLASGIASITSFPPKVPGYIIGWYDYPILRVFLLAIVSGVGVYVPEIALLLAIGYGILGEDIIKTSSKFPSNNRDTDKEGFMTSSSSEELEHIQLLPGPSDMMMSKDIVTKKTASLDGIQNTLRSLQAQIQTMVGK
jgi:hypothetical protein